jgi:hypothetical protein
MYEQLRLTELKQRAGLDYSIDTFIKMQQPTMFGNVYWGNDNYRFFDNSIQNTLVMYRLLRAKGGHEGLMQKVRGYFLEKRKSGEWRNTYESSLILETILPELMVNDSVAKPAMLTISGTQSYTVTKFPFALQLNGGQQLSVHKSGNLPVYFTAYRQHWNRSPQKVSADFDVSSFFERNELEIKHLKAGESVILKTKVHVSADADYVMVEIPIPAGCSYKEKVQPFINNEVHREYFKNKVSIFCSTLKKGDYIFTVSLMPRYTGSYHLNPAKAEMMYFPVFFGREAIRRVEIE